ncbi:MAG: ATP-binding cassette domain-containing protein [Halobacteriaceae archaeon]
MNVTVTDLTVRRGDATVLSDVSLSVDSGSFVGVVGPNGAGKTTLVQTMNGTLTPAAGEVRVGGDDVHALPSKAASRRVATLPQNPALDFEFTGREVVEMGRYPHAPRFGGDPDPDAVDRALELTEATALADRPITSLSGGERQRILVARAVAQDAPVVLLDEPTASLDVNHQMRTLGIARDLAAEGRTVVAAIHDLDLAARFCDELALLAAGGVVAAGPPAEVLTPDAVERAFGVAAAVTTDPVTGAPLVTALPEQSGDAGNVHVVGGGGRAAPLLYPLRAAGFSVSLGPVPSGDRDAEVTRALGGDVVTAPPFEPLDESLTAVEERIEDADAVVVADVDVHPGTLPLLDAAADAESLVVVSDRSLDARNGAGEAGRERWRRLESRGREASPTDVPDAVAEAVTEMAPKSKGG